MLEELSEMETHGLIEPSTSEWSAPIVVVDKKDGTGHYGCVSTIDG